MPLPLDDDPRFAQYAHPERLVSSAWVAEHLGEDGLVVAETDEDVLLYETGHIPTAVKVDWHTDLNDPVTRDYVDGEGFAELMSSRGISRDDTVVLYGDKNNWWAAYAFWFFSYNGHKNLKLMNGGRVKWVKEGKSLSTEVPSYPRGSYTPGTRDPSLRAFKDEVLARLDEVKAGRAALVDVRSPAEFSGEKTHMPEYPQEGVLRGGHIPGAQNIPWAQAANEDGTFKSAEELRSIYEGEAGLQQGDDVIAYCRIGERSSHTWFVLKYLLGYDHVRNYDGSWTEWGNAVRVPIEK